MFSFQNSGNIIILTGFPSLVEERSLLELEDYASEHVSSETQILHYVA
jgi:hypothetical protein